MDFKNAQELLELCKKENCTISSIMKKRECVLSETTEEDVYKRQRKGFCDLTHLSFHSGSCDNHFSTSINNGGTHVSHVFAVAQRNVLLTGIQLQETCDLVCRN